MSQDNRGWGFSSPDDPYGANHPYAAGQASQWGQPTPATPRPIDPSHPVTGQQPGVIPLSPLTLGEIFDGGFQVMRRQPVPVFGSAGVVAALAGLLTILTQVVVFSAIGPAETLSAAGLWALGATTVAALLLLLVAQALATGVLVLPTTRAATGRSSTFAGVWKEASRRIVPLVGWPLLQALIVTVVFAALLGLPLALGLAVDAGFLALLLLSVPAGIALWAWALAKFSFVPSVIMVEEAGLLAAVARSYRLTRGVFWRVLGILILTSIIAGFVSTLVQAPFSFLGGVLTGFGNAGSGGVSMTSLTVGAIGQAIGTMISIPFVACVTTLLYVDIRMRREDLHVELARSAERGVSGRADSAG